MQMIRLGFAILFVFSMIMSADAQCVMCKAVAEDSAAAGGLGEGLNRGILYLMAVPYVLLGALGYIFFRKRARG